MTIVQEFHGEEVEWTRGAAISVLGGTHAEAIDVDGSSFTPFGLPGMSVLVFGIAALLLLLAALEYNKRRRCRKNGILSVPTGKNIY